MADKKQNAVIYGEVVAKCWEDEAYKKRFIEDPESVLTEAGFAVEEGVTYKVVEQPKLVKYVVLPAEDPKEAVQVVAKGFLNASERKDVIIPEGAEVRIIQNTDDTHYMVLPASPKSLTQAELAMVAGGDSAKVNTNVVLNAEVTINAVEAVDMVTTAQTGAEVSVVAIAIGVLI